MFTSISIQPLDTFFGSKQPRDPQQTMHQAWCVLPNRVSRWEKVGSIQPTRSPIAIVGKMNRCFLFGWIFRDALKNISKIVIHPGGDEDHPHPDGFGAR